MTNDKTPSPAQGAMMTAEEATDKLAYAVFAGEHVIRSDEKEYIDGLVATIRQELAALREEVGGLKVTENTSDGYHTFKELYEHRILLYLTALRGGAFKAQYVVEDHYPEWDLIVSFTPGNYQQISYHVPTKYRPLYEHMDRQTKESQEKAFDGHDSKLVAHRIEMTLRHWDVANQPPPPDQPQAEPKIIREEGFINDGVKTITKRTAASLYTEDGFTDIKYQSGGKPQAEPDVKRWALYHERDGWYDGGYDVIFARRELAEDELGCTLSPGWRVVPVKIVKVEE